jgi:hypothetical protein
MGESKDKQIQPLSKDPLANLSIEELEQRLEMQMLVFHITPDQCGSYACGTFGACSNLSCKTYVCSNH